VSDVGILRLILLTLAILSLSCASHRVPVPPQTLKSTAEYLDLRPGVRLNVEKAYYARGSSGRGLDCFLGTQLATFGVQTNGVLQFLGVEAKPFRDGLASQIPADQLIPAYMRGKRFNRFYYAVPYVRSNQPTASVLLAGKSAKEIDMLSGQLKAAPDQVCSPQSMRCTVFPEGSTVSIMMDIVVNGVPKVVMWGSVVGSVTGGRPAASLERRDLEHSEPVRLEGQSASMRLLPGDRVSF